MLEYLTLAREPVRLSAIATALKLQKSTVHRVLSTLSGLGYVEQEPQTGCYRATLKLWELGVNTLEAHAVRRAAAAFLQELQRATGETVSLAVLSGDDALYLDKLVPPRVTRLTARVGSRLPAPLTAAGLAMLAHHPDARGVMRRAAARIKKAHRFEPDKLMKELAEIQERGYAVSSYSYGVISFAAPVMSRDGQAAAALIVSMASECVTAKKKAEIIARVLSAAARMSEKAGL